jgi:CDP-diacylglycerol--serine O-phosphatidyltransferase
LNRVVLIIVAVALSSLVYLGFVLVLKTPKGRDFLGRSWYFNPNVICIWRVIIGLSSTVLYFVYGQHTWAILFFTLSAFMDGIDGLIARSCDLASPFGEELDPLCDKLTYLPPFLFFSYRGLLSIPAVYALLIIEICGQFLVRYIIKRFTSFSVAANNFGKVKAVLCFFLIIYLALLDDGLPIPKIANHILYVCIVLSVSSSIFKIISNRFYADILSSLNLLCGLVGIFLVFQGLYVYVAITILTGQIFDLLDGRMAEKHGGTKVGPWFDDIADLISFGLCPGLLIFLKGGSSLPSFVFGGLYFFSIAFRLWRFLARDRHDESLPPGVFKGLPSPAGAMVPLGVCLLLENQWIEWGAILLTSFFLVSHVRFVHFGRVVLRRIPRTFTVLIGVAIVFMIAYFTKARDSQMLGALLLTCFSIYIIISGRITIAREF